MSILLYMKCACGGEFRQESGLSEYVREEWRDQWMVEHKGHGDDMALTQEVKEIKAKLAMVADDAGIVFGEPAVIPA